MFSLYWEKFLLLLPNNKWAIAPPMVIPPAPTVCQAQCLALGDNVQSRNRRACPLRVVFSYKHVSSIHILKTFILLFKYTHLWHFVFYKVFSNVTFCHLPNNPVRTAWILRFFSFSNKENWAQSPKELATSYICYVLSTIPIATNLGKCLECIYKYYFYKHYCS